MAFRSLLHGNLSADALRSIALYVTYAIHKPTRPVAPFPRSPSGASGPKRLSSNPGRRKTLAGISSAVGDTRASSVEDLSRSQMGVKILEMYTDILCHVETTNIKKFARTVTNKVQSKDDKR